MESKIVIKPLNVDDSGFIFEEDNNEIIEHNLASEFSPICTMANIRRNSIGESIDENPNRITEVSKANLIA